MVYGAQGATLHYAVNIIGIYKTEGTIWYKGKKSKFIDEKYDAYSDGIYYWRAERKKKEVQVYNMDDDSRDKYSTKFKFEPNNYKYSIRRDEKAYWITLEAKKGVKGIKEATVQLDLKKRYPQSIRLKLGIFHTTVKISNFKTGGIPDNIFVFDKRKYSDYKLVDNRIKASH
jgi:outer membrane lipoprotein-sorting protein